MENITYSDYNHLKKNLIDFEIKYYDFYLKGDILLLADAFEKFRKIILSICLLYPETSLSSQISLKNSFKKNNVILESLADIDMFLVVKKKN